MKNTRFFKRVELPISIMLFLIFVGFNLITSFFVFQVSYQNSTESLLESALFYTERITSQTVKNLDEYIREYELLMTALSKNAHLIKRITEDDSLTIEEKLLYEKQCMVYLKHIMESKTGTAGILIVGSNGYLYTDDARAMLNTNYNFVNSDWFQNTFAFEGEEILNISTIQVDFYLKHSTLYGKRLTTLSYPIRNYSNQKIGVIYVFLDMSALKSSLYLDDFQEFEGVFLINQDQKIVLHRDETQLDQVITGNAFLSTGDGANLSQRDRSADDIWAKVPSRYAKADAVSRISMEGIRQRASQYQKPLIMSLFISFIAVFTVGFLMFIFFHRGTNRLMLDLNSARSDPNEFAPKNYHVRELNHIAIQIASLLESIKALDKKNYEMQVSNQLAQLNALIAQLNPHFLFNALQMLQTDLACGNRDNGDEIIVKLSKLLRYSVNKMKTFVELEEELDFVNGYLAIFQQETAGRLEYNVMCPAELLNICVPKFAIQPLVENAIRHGFSERTEDMKITITASACHDSVVISVIDNGKGLAPDALHKLLQTLENAALVSENLTNVGLHNIHYRIQLLYGPQYGLNISSVEGSYTKVDILLPRKDEKHEAIDS